MVVALLLAIEPFLQIALLLALVAVTFLLAAKTPQAHVIDAVAVPLELAVTCWLLSARLERRAQTEEHALVELLLGLGGDLARASPPRTHTARERVEEKTPLLQLTARDLLHMARETPCRATRITVAWVALVLATTPMARWLWHAFQHEGAASIASAILIAACAATFAIAWNDLRVGRVRSLSDPRRTRMWSNGYQPVPAPTVVPSTPMLLILLFPAGLLGANWASGHSFGSRVGVTQAVFGFWLLLWNGRAAISSAAFRRVEQLTAPVDGLIRRGIAPTWDLLLRACRWSGWGSAALFALALSLPFLPRSAIVATVTDVSVWLLTASLVLGLLCLIHLQRPVAPQTRSGQTLLEELGDTQIRRITVWLNVGFGTTMLLVAVLGGQL